MDDASANSLPPTNLLTMVIPADAAGQRLDSWLASALSADMDKTSRSEIKRWISDGLVQLDGAQIKASQRLEAGQNLSVELPPPPKDPSLLAEELPLTIAYEDANLLVVDKAAGMVVHPSAGHQSGTLVNAILYHVPDLQGVGGEKRPGIVHRLDKETSGLIVIAKNDPTHRFLQEQFQQRKVYKEYLALLEGKMEPSRGRISAPLGRHPTDRKRQAVLPPDPFTGESKGREAITDYETLSVYSTSSRDSMGRANFTLVRVELHTGRTHQIRVHFAWQKHPVVGDTTYGFRKQRLPLERHFLHAHKLRIKIPTPDGTSQMREFEAPLPPELSNLLDQIS